MITEDMTPEEVQEQVEACLDEMYPRFKMWLSEHDINMKEFSAISGLSYSKLQRFARSHRAPMDLLISMLIVDPTIGDHWATATEKYKERRQRSYRPTAVTNIDPDVCKAKLIDAQRTIAMLQEELAIVRKEAAEKEGRIIYYLEKLRAIEENKPKE